MVRWPCFDSNGMKKGAWSEDEDNKLRDFILTHGHWNWRLLPKHAGLKRCGKSCRLRWVNHLKPGVKRGNFSKEEEGIIVKLHALIGNKWSAIAAELPGRTDNNIKNFWNTRIARRRNPNSAAVEAASSSSFSSSSMDDHDQLLEMAPNHQTDDATSLIDIHESKAVTFDAANCNRDYAGFLPLITEEELYYPQIYYNELSSSDMNVLDWVAEEEHSIMFNSVSGSIWDESFALTSSDCQPQTRVCVPLERGVYDPVFCLWDS